MTRSEDLLSRLQAFLEHSGMSLREFAALANISHSTVSRLLRGKQEPSLDSIHRIEDVLSRHATGGFRADHVPNPCTNWDSRGLLLILLLAMPLGLTIWQHLRTEPG